MAQQYNAQLEFSCGHKAHAIISPTDQQEAAEPDTASWYRDQLVERLANNEGCPVHGFSCYLVGWELWPVEAKSA